MIGIMLNAHASAEIHSDIRVNKLVTNVFTAIPQGRNKE